MNLPSEADVVAEIARLIPYRQVHAVAAACGLSEVTLYRIQRGGKGFRYHTLDVLLRHLQKLNQQENTNDEDETQPGGPAPIDRTTIERSPEGT